MKISRLLRAAASIKGKPSRRASRSRQGGYLGIEGAIRMDFWSDDQGEYVSNDAVDSVKAAAGLGTSRGTLLRLRRLGLIPAYSVPSRIPGKVMWRYRMEDLMKFMKTQRNQIHAWDPRSDGELPAIVVARILDVSLQDVYLQKHRGRLKNYRPETVRRYVLNRYGKKMEREIEQELKSELRQLKAEYRRLRVVETRLRGLLKQNLCESCTKPI
jgi:hypothetical protein